MLIKLICLFLNLKIFLIFNSLKFLHCTVVWPPIIFQNPHLPWDHWAPIPHPMDPEVFPPNHKRLLENPTASKPLGTGSTILQLVSIPKRMSTQLSKISQRSFLVKSCGNENSIPQFILHVKRCLFIIVSHVGHFVFSFFTPTINKQTKMHSIHPVSTQWVFLFFLFMSVNSRNRRGNYSHLLNCNRLYLLTDILILKVENDMHSENSKLQKLIWK